MTSTEKYYLMAMVLVVVLLFTALYQAGEFYEAGDTLAAIYYLLKALLGDLGLICALKLREAGNEDSD